MAGESKRERRRQEEGLSLPLPRVIELLQHGAIDVQGLVTWSSNYTFLVHVTDAEGKLVAIYKPARGERPLWDFETGSLCKREVAAYRVSRLLGWPNIPPTVLREGPQGLGMVQLFVDCYQDQHFFTLRARHPDAMREIAVFDALINNTDRKGGHVLLGRDGKVWAIDHGVTFHEYPKLRTVIWDFIGEPISARLMSDLCALDDKFQRRDPSLDALRECLTSAEMRALRERLKELISARIYPEPPEDWPHIPWPPV